MLSSKELIALERKYSAQNYHPLPVVIAKGVGIRVYTPEGKSYLDYLSAYSALNQGHAHPKIIQALTNQAQTLTLSSRAFYNSLFPQYAKYVTEYFGYERVLPMNTGAEAVETAIKAARKWAYMKKGVPDGKAMIIACADNFHGRTLGVISMSTDPSSRDGFGPFLPLVGAVCPNSGLTMTYGDTEALEKVFAAHGTEMAGFLVEPIQGEAGVKVPPDSFLKRAKELCELHNVLFICDEVQTGIARTGKMLAIEHINIRPDIIILGKALSGGVYPVSAILADNHIMSCIRPGEHGSTYGGNPLACAVAMAALEVVKEEGLVERAAELGEFFRKSLLGIKSPLISEVRGRGLLNAIEIDHNFCPGKTAWQVCLLLKEHGLLAKPTHDTIIRLAPPLCITREEIDQSVEAIKKALNDLDRMSLKELQEMEVKAEEGDF